MGITISTLDLDDTGHSMTDCYGKITTTSYEVGVYAKCSLLIYNSKADRDNGKAPIDPNRKYSFTPLNNDKWDTYLTEDKLKEDGKSLCVRLYEIIKANDPEFQSPVTITDDL